MLNEEKTNGATNAVATTGTETDNILAAAKEERAFDKLLKFKKATTLSVTTKSRLAPNTWRTVSVGRNAGSSR